MKQTNKLKMIAAMAISVLSFTITGCSSDDFFGLEEMDDTSLGQNDILNPREQTSIASSQEYVNYITAFYEFLNEALDIDTTKMDILTIMKGKPVYYKINSISFSFVSSKMKELNKAYPKFFTYDYSQQKYIEDLSFSQDKTLGNLASKVRQMPKRTKGINPEDAFSWCISQGYTNPSPGVFKYNKKGLTMKLGTAAYCMDQAISHTVSNGVEFGGYSWYDGSGIWITDDNATEHTMHFPHVSYTPYPQYDFHVHPNILCDKTPSDEDWDTWENSVISNHIIFDRNGQCVTYYW